MDWEKFTGILARELGAETAERVAAALMLAVGGLRVRVPAPHPVTGTRRPTDAEVRQALAAHGYNVRRAAEALGIAPSSLYRRLAPKPRTRPEVDPGPRLDGRLVR